MRIGFDRTGLLRLGRFQAPIPASRRMRAPSPPRRGRPDRPSAAAAGLAARLGGGCVRVSDETRTRGRLDHNPRVVQSWLYFTAVGGRLADHHLVAVSTRCVADNDDAGHSLPALCGAAQVRIDSGNPSEMSPETRIPS